MKLKPKSSPSIFGLAFMDCICCGFGAVILLLVMNKGVNQGAIEESAKVNESILRKVQDEIAVIRGESVVRNIELEGLQEQLSKESVKVARLREQEFETKGKFAATKDLSEIIAEKKRALFEAKQKRDELRNTPPAWKTDVVGGIPADSEYVIFIIDTSGSMDRIARTVAVKLKETLAVYPKIKGMQIMNADGRYMDPTSSGRWLPATGKGRLDILRSYFAWNNNSSSTPVGGLLEAIRTYSKSDKEISIYVFGDDFTGDLDHLIQLVDSYNPVQSDGRRMIRIHGVGFPAAFGGDSRSGGGKFAKAMRALAERNGGAFVTINQ